MAIAASRMASSAARLSLPCRLLLWRQRRAAASAAAASAGGERVRGGGREPGVDAGQPARPPDKQILDFAPPPNIDRRTCLGLSVGGVSECRCWQWSQAQSHQQRSSGTTLQIHTITRRTREHPPRTPPAPRRQLPSPRAVVRLMPGARRRQRAVLRAGGRASQCCLRAARRRADVPRREANGGGRAVHDGPTQGLRRLAAGVAWRVELVVDPRLREPGREQRCAQS